MNHPMLVGSTSRPQATKSCSGPSKEVKEAGDGWRGGRGSGAVSQQAMTRKRKSLQRGVRRAIRTGGAGHLSLAILHGVPPWGDEKRRRPSWAVVFLLWGR
jgi:hypothetical protein